MKKVGTLIMLIAMILNLFACAKTEEETVAERVRAVKILEIKEAMKPVTLDYIGTVDSKDMVKYSFKSNGKIRRLYVEKGNEVESGQKLVELDVKDLKLQIEAARLKLDTAQLNIKKAEDSLKYNDDLLKRIEALYKTGAASRDKYDQVKLQRDVAQTEYNQAKTQYEAGKADYDYMLTLLEDSALYAESDGIIVETLYEENERIAAFNPVVVVRSKKQIVNIGASQTDVKKINLGTEAIINVDGEMAEGIVTNIAEAPDSSTRTYTTEIEMNKDFRLGSIAEVSLKIGEEKGIWVPINSIMSNGMDYVYVVENDRALKREVELGEIYEDSIMVKGLKVGDKMVISGMKNLTDGSKVNIQE